MRVLDERYGIDLAKQLPRHLDTFAGRQFDYIITLCDKVREVCLEIGDAAHRVHWSIPDPAAATVHDQPDYSEFVRTAAEIDTRVRHLITKLALKEAQP